MSGLLPDLLRFRYEEIRPLGACRAPIDRFIVLTWGENPTYDYYIRPRLGDMPTMMIDISGHGSRSDLDLRPGDYVLICRYLTHRWAHHIAKAPDLAGVGLLFDDDYVAFLADRSIPLLYRLDVLRRTVLPLRAIRMRTTDILVSTETLRDRFYEAQATVLQPSPSYSDLDPMPRPVQGPIRIAFHAQLSHLADHALAADIARGLAGNPRDLIFDVIGPPKAKRLWENVPFAQFRDELAWPVYRQHSRKIGADILIAPMLDTPLNQARSPTKAIDAVRMGAAAIFSRARPYQALGESAVLVDGSSEAWRSALHSLINDRDELVRRASRLRAEVTSWIARTEPLSQTLR